VLNVNGEFMKLEHLPREHPLRNKPLIEIKAWYSNRGGSWSEVFPSFGIAKKTYNELGDVWINEHSWESRDDM
jgi:hypothetical protein